mgnify:CR=1 FL=1
MKEKNKNMWKAIGTGMILGGAIAGGGVYASTVGAGNVSYSNASSGLSATNVQKAIDETYTNIATLKGIQATTICGNEFRSFVTSAGEKSITACAKNLDSTAGEFYKAATKAFGYTSEYCYLNWLQNNVSSSGWKECCSGVCKTIGGASSTCPTYCQDADSIVKYYQC